MRYSHIQSRLLIPLMCLAVTTTAGAGDPSSLVRACPTLAPIDGLPAGATVIDNQTVLRLAQKGRIAAVSNRPDSVVHQKKSPPADLSATKTRWRSQHRKSVSVLHGFKKHLSEAQAEHEALKSRFFNASNEMQRIRMRPKLDAKAFEVNQIRQKLRAAEASFSSLIRRARIDGAQPGWFRDLPRP